MAATEGVRVVEFYSGIGGMHFAIQMTCIPHKIVAAMELNDVANEVYKFNFPRDNLLQKNIEGLTVREMEDLSPDVILMSPPCQPFTRVGNQKASDDPRTRSFLNILKVLKSMKNPPKYILLENVKGFEVSRTREQLVEAVDEIGYEYQEFLISPRQLGIPNSRLRYYFLAKLKPLNFQFKTSPVVLDSMPQHLLEQQDGGSCKNENNRSPLSDFLENHEDIDGHCYLSCEVLGKLGTVLDIVTPGSRSSCCFTKAYGTFVKGTGSVLTEKTEHEIRQAFELASSHQDELSKGRQLQELKLRYFTPPEISRLMCFPESFDFPSSVTRKQRYKLLGNSVNVKVVAELLKKCLITENIGDRLETL